VSVNVTAHELHYSEKLKNEMKYTLTLSLLNTKQDSVE